MAWGHHLRECRYRGMHHVLTSWRPGLHRAANSAGQSAGVHEHHVGASGQRPSPARPSTRSSPSPCRCDRAANRRDALPSSGSDVAEVGRDRVVARRAAAAVALDLVVAHAARSASDEAGSRHGRGRPMEGRPATTPLATPTAITSGTICPAATRSARDRATESGVGAAARRRADDRVRLDPLRPRTDP